MPAIWANSILFVLLVLASQTEPGNFVSGDGPADVAQDGNERTDSLVEDLLEAAYDCRLHYAQLPDSFTRLSLYHLALRGKQGSEQAHDARQLSALMRVIELEPSVNGTEKTPQLSLEKLALDPELPFVFFTNGFNHDGVLDGTWMRDVASVYFARYLAPTDDADGSEGAHKRPAGVNVIFLNWHMEGLLADSPLSAILVYYKTMANYDIIVAKFQTVIQQIIEHLDELRSRQNLATSTSPEGRDYFAKFRFFGHSLGSHILAHALAGIHKSRPHLQFGQIHGLDPALPCFLGDQQGLTASKVSGIAREAVIVHSNAGILGAYSDRGQLEIVLNGGTFQPNCSLFDLNCHHVRSTQVLGYLDDTCKMVAYKCNKYEQFKLGACETCDSPQVTTRNASSSANCVLANLEEQNEDSRLIERIISSSSNRPNSVAAEQRVRQLADSDKFSYNFERASSIRLALAKSELDYYLRNAKREYHYVNTNPEFERTPQRSHCLQHYQLRLLTLRPRVSSGAEDVACPLKPMHGDRINLRLFHESVLPFLDYDGPQASPDRRRRSLARGDDQNLDKFELRTILDNQLHTGLATFGGEPRLFVGAAIDNLDLRSWLKCQTGRQRNATSPSGGPLELVLDVAFMSHTSKSVRHAFSSVLCASWLPTASSQKDSGQTNSTLTTSPDEPLMLDLCRQSELTDVSARIDRLIRQVKFQNQFEPWHVILLNSLFSLFAGWEPL